MTSHQCSAGAGLEKPVRPQGANLFSCRAAMFGLLFLAMGATLVTAASPAAAEAPLAIKGYDPVAYFTDEKPTPGRLELEYEWDEHIWRFATANHRDLFKANPVHYAPQFGNYCAMALSKGEVVVADPENWLISDGKLFVFGKPAPAGPALFKQQLEANIAKANQNRPILPR